MGTFCFYGAAKEKQNVPKRRGAIDAHLRIKAFELEEVKQSG